MSRMSRCVRSWCCPPCGVSLVAVLAYDVTWWKIMGSKIIPLDISRSWHFNWYPWCLNLMKWLCDCVTVLYYAVFWNVTQIQTFVQIDSWATVVWDNLSTISKWQDLVLHNALVLDPESFQTSQTPQKSRQMGKRRSHFKGAAVVMSLVKRGAPISRIDSGLAPFWLLQCPEDPRSVMWLHLVKLPELAMINSDGSIARRRASRNKCSEHSFHFTSFPDGNFLYFSFDVLFFPVLPLEDSLWRGCRFWRRKMPSSKSSYNFCRNVSRPWVKDLPQHFQVRSHNPKRTAMNDCDQLVAWLILFTWSLACVATMLQIHGQWRGAASSAVQYQWYHGRREKRKKQMHIKWY